MCVCPVCKGGGWVIVRKSTPRTKEVYKDDREVEFAEPCPHCNGGAEQKAEEVRTRANIPSAYYDASIDKFKWDIYLDNENHVIDISLQKKYVMSFIKDFEKWQEKGIGFYIYSKSRGTGKTFLASCICNSLMTKYQITTKFVSASDLITIAKEARQGEKNPIDTLCECKVLVLDDIGQKTSGEDWQNDLLFKIIDSRYQSKLVTLFTSNVKSTELRADDRITSRIEKMSQNIPLPEYSFRSKAAYDEKKRLLQGDWAVMTNYEMIKGLILHNKLDNLAHFMCESMDYISEGYPCEYCPVRDKCEAASMNGNGWFHWLREEAEC